MSLSTDLPHKLIKLYAKINLNENNFPRVLNLQFIFLKSKPGVSNSKS